MADTQLTFTEGELETLRGIVKDWINERLAIPPYPSQFDTLIDKVLDGATMAPAVRGAGQQSPRLRANLG